MSHKSVLLQYHDMNGRMHQAQIRVMEELVKFDMSFTKPCAIHYKKSTIFRRLQLFSVAWRVATKNKVIFGVLCGPPTIGPQNRRM
jgi:hypothetical protein